MPAEKEKEIATGTDLELSVPPTAVSVPIARRFITAVARAAGCPDDLIEDAKLAISEALTNSIKAQVRTGAEEPIRILTRLEDEGVLVSVHDHGAGIVELPATATFTPPGGLFEGSLGMALIQSLFPDVEIVSKQGVGTTVRFHIRPRSVD